MNESAGIVSDKQRKIETIKALYYHSDLSVDSIANQVDMTTQQVKRIIGKIKTSRVLEDVFGEQSKTKLEKVMITDVLQMEYTETAYDAANFMLKKGIGSVVVTKKGRPFGIFTEKDVIRGVVEKKTFTEFLLEEAASQPLVMVNPKTTVEKATSMMIKYNIHKLPVISRGKVVGMVTVTDLARFLSPTRRPGLADSILRVISRETAASKSR